MITHGELFAGIGGFGCGFGHVGIETKWHVEIDKQCQSILIRHWIETQIESNVCLVGKHNLCPVDIISFGSPCQDLSIAGLRKGFQDGTRSNLFFEAVRIVREINPRYAIWENVPGALSSHGGADFKSVLESLLDAKVPMPKSGRWATAGMVRTGQKEIAWRVLDAQYFGVPQRRRRIFLIFCPRGDSAAEILFESEGVSGDTPPSREAGKEVAYSLRANPSHSSDKGDGGINKTMVMTLGHSQSHGLGIGEQNTANTLEGTSSSNQAVLVGALQARDYKGVGNQYVNEGKLVFDAAQITSKQHGSLPSEISQPLNTLGQMSVFDRQRSDEYGEAATVDTVAARDYKSASDLIIFQQNQRDEVRDMGERIGALEAEPGMHSQNFLAFTPRRTNYDGVENISPTLNMGGGGHGSPAVSWTIRGGKEGGGKGFLASEDRAMTLGGQEQYLWEMSHADEAVRENGEVVPTLQARMGTGGNQVPMVGVRRLMPIECERLQGFPSIKETIIIDVCLDHQKNFASAEIQSRKSQKHAESAGKIGLSESAPFVGMNMNTNDQLINKLAQPSVLINCGDRKVEILSQEKLLLSASFVEDKNLFPLLTQSEDFALLLAGLNTILAQITQRGAEALHPKEQGLIHQKDGLSAVRLSGNEMMQLVKNAESTSVINKKLLKSIISDPLNLKIADTTLTTLLYSVIRAISGYIPKEILKSNLLRIEINTDFGWTFGQSDSARYRQLGNAVAVPVVEWIAKRIVRAEAHTTPPVLGAGDSLSQPR